MLDAIHFYFGIHILWGLCPGELCNIKISMGLCPGDYIQEGFCPITNAKVVRKLHNWNIHMKNP